ncbi:unnamed protein product [Phytophthora fragariaefolia]|uniref:Unnamed protein product n=1 Tax=Phytophthora fragariaefolia TaxID=1490495 RepID=A0A9W7CXG3_9STRA|nr:unnamed protein product [Phytophthora fragariaefolia]
MSTGSPNAAATHVAREDCPHLADPEWEAVQRLATVIGEAAFLDLQQGKHDVHAYAQRARYLVSNIVTNPIDEATKVVTFMKGLRDGPVKTYLFREYPSTLEAAITLAMQEEFILRQAKLHANVPRPMPRPVVKPTGGPEPMEYSSATAAGSQQRRGSTNVRCFRCGNNCHYSCECTAPVHAAKGRRDDTGVKRDAVVSTVFDTQAEQEEPVTEGSELGASAPGADAIGSNIKGRPASLHYRKMELENPPTLASELTSLPAMSWKRFTRDLHDGRIEQICILSGVERMKCEAEELRQLVTAGAKSKKERFDDEQSWDSLKSSPLYEVLREYKDVLPDDIPTDLPHDKGVQHEIDLVSGTKYSVTRQWPLPRDQVKEIDDFYESRRKTGQVRELKSPYSSPTFCVKKAQDG